MSDRERPATAGPEDEDTGGRPPAGPRERRDGGEAARRRRHAEEDARRRREADDVVHPVGEAEASPGTARRPRPVPAVDRRRPSWSVPAAPR
jgi:hypothetical protein